ncbi:MAG: pyridoxamine 5'-phosphate oxidase family protein [Dehalococcoidia bacterium]
MARMKADVLAEFLTKPINAVLATTRRQSRPYQVPVWFLWQETGPAAAEYPFYREGDFWLTGTYTRQWCKHIFADPRVSLCIEGGGPVPGYVAVNCQAVPVEPKDTDIWPISTKLAQKYVGARGDEEAVARFMANMRTEPRLLFRLTPESWRCIDLTVYTGARGDVAYQRSRREG